jgi:hypothetical protein
VFLLSRFGLILGYRPNSVRNFDWLPFTPTSSRLFGPSVSSVNLIKKTYAAAALKKIVFELITELTKLLPLEKSISEGGQYVMFRRRH